MNYTILIYETPADFAKRTGAAMRLCRLTFRVTIPARGRLVGSAER